MLAQLLRKKAKTMPIWLLKLLANHWSPFKGAGIKIVHLTKDYRHMVVQMPLRWWNKNYVGTHFGGSLYAMTDPFYMMMFINNLGPEYIVWDKAAKVEFKKPGKGLVEARFDLTVLQIAHVRQAADEQGKYVFDIEVDVMDQEGDVVATMIKTLYVRRRESKLASTFK